MRTLICLVVLLLASHSSWSQVAERAGIQFNPDIAIDERASNRVSDVPTDVSRAARAFRIDPAALPRSNVSVYTEGLATRLTPDNLSRLITPSSVIVERTADTVLERRDASGQTRFTLPVTFTQIEVDASGTAREIKYAPEVLPRTALRYFGDRREYVATLGVGIWEQNPSGSRSLTEEIGIALASLSLSTIVPIDLRFQQLNAFSNVEVTAQRVTGAPLLSVRPDFEPTGFDVPVPVGEQPSLILRFSRPSTLGLGLGTVTASVEVLNVVNPEGLEVDLRIDSGSIENDSRVILDESGRGTVTVRSTGLGRSRLWSEDSLFASVDDDEIEFSMPWLFVLAVLAGGVAGTVATERGRKAWGGAMVSGVVTGIVVVAAYAVGINLLTVEPAATAGEALAFVLAALGAAAGGSILQPKGSG